MILTPLLWVRAGGENRSHWSRWIPFAAPVLLSFGMLALFLDLSYKLHVLRFYAAFRWTSPMSWGAWILIAIYPASLLLGFLGLTEDELERLAGLGPLKAVKLGSFLKWARGFAAANERMVLILNIAVGVGLGSYIGLLLGTLGARAVWSSAMLGPLFLVSGISTGAAFMMLFPLAEKERSFLRNYDLGAIGLELGLIAFYLIGLATGGAAGRDAADLFLGGRYTATFWSLVVVSGLAIPLFMEAMEARKSLLHTTWAPVLLLIGGLDRKSVV
jgi:formate-dependent nitrite reductase membrane component NrfD